MNWIKTASVTTGGKPFFYTTITPHGQRAWVVWDRFTRTWACQGECPQGGTITFEDGFKSANQGMDYMDKGVKEAQNVYPHLA